MLGDPFLNGVRTNALWTSAPGWTPPDMVFDLCVLHKHTGIVVYENKSSVSMKQQLHDRSHVICLVE